MTTEGKKLFSLACDITKLQAGIPENTVEERLKLLEDTVEHLNNMIKDQVRINCSIIDILKLK